VLFRIRPIASPLEVICYLKSAVEVKCSKLFQFLPSSENGSVWMTKAPPFGLKLLRLERTLKILSSGHKKPRPNYTPKELLTSKLREENPFYLSKDSQLHFVLFGVFVLLSRFNPPAKVIIKCLEADYVLPS